MTFRLGSAVLIGWRSGPPGRPQPAYEVQIAPDYRLALEVLESNALVDLLVCDIVMPDRVNGLALGRMARLRRPELKIIYITGHDIPGVEDEALGPVLRKPIDNDLFVAEIERVLAR
jgi:CheY-like chemotaxis protein